MKIQKFVIGLTVTNFMLLLVTVAQATSIVTPPATPLLQVQALELVDEKRQVRSRLNVEADGTVVFRMLDEEGTIRVKLGADKNGSGLVLLDEATEPGVHIIARQKGSDEKAATTGITLQGAKGRRVIEP